MNPTPLNPDALAHARSAAFDCWENGGNMDDLAECAIEAYLAVAQPVVNSDKASAWDEGYRARRDGDMMDTNPYEEEQ